MRQIRTPAKGVSRYYSSAGHTSLVVEHDVTVSASAGPVTTVGPVGHVQRWLEDRCAFCGTEIGIQPGDAASTITLHDHGPGLSDGGKTRSLQRFWRGNHPSTPPSR